MEISAEKIAKFLWIAAAALVVLQWVSFFILYPNVGQQPQFFWTNLLAVVANNLLYSGGLAGLGG